MLTLRRICAVSRTLGSPSSSSIAAEIVRRQTLSSCIVPSRKSPGNRYNVPPSAEFVARVSGIPTMAKLPYQETADGLDAAFVGVPIDTGTSNRPGARFGPRQIRVESAMLRCYNSGTRAAPYESLMVADIGDVNVNMFDLKDTCRRIREAYRKIVATGCVPLTLGGDHTIAYPILQAVAEKYGPVGLVHVDAHADTSDVVLGEKIGHGTPFRRCVEEGLLDCKRVVQIGLRGTGYSADSYEWSRAQAVFNKKRFQNSLKPFTSGYKLEDYIIGNQIGKGSNAAVYEAAATFAPPAESKTSQVQLKDNEEEEQAVRSVTCCSLRNFPLAIKMMWNFGTGSSSEVILKSMSQELVPAGPQALKQEKENISLDGRFGVLQRRLSAHPNVISVYRAFTADVPLLPGALEEYPDMLPARFNPTGLGNNRTLFLVMKNYPYTLRQFLEGSALSHRQRTLIVLQLLEGVDHLCRQGVAHRDLKSDNVLLEFDSEGDPRLVISDFGCCLSQSDCSLQLPFNSVWVSRGGNASLMAPEVTGAVPGIGVVIDYSKADAWAVGAIAYEVFEQHNPFYRAVGLESRSYREEQLPPLPSSVPGDVKLVIRLLLRRNPDKRPSARVAANMLHLSLWGRKALAGQDGTGMRKLVDWLLCQTAAALLKGCRGPRGNTVEAELQRSFLRNLELEEMRAAVGFLLYGRERHQACILSA